MAGTGTDIVTPLTVEALQTEIALERQKRIEEHKLAIAAEIAGPAGPQFAAKLKGRLNIFAEGDSWFDYPFTPDVVQCVKFFGTPQPLILNLAHHGDAATEMLGVKKRQRIIDNLKDPANGKFDALLFSGGGNDIAGDQFCLWLTQNVGNDPTYGINRQRLADMLGVIEGAYVDLVQIRDQFARDCTIFVHAYDFAQPTGQGVCGLGPWLKPSLDFRRWTNFPQAAQIVKEVMQGFDKLMTRFEQEHKGVVYVRTQGTLSPNSDWANELHPNEQGFVKVAQVFLDALKKSFPGRI